VYGYEVRSRTPVKALADACDIHSAA
jgi:hypothetical protein